jgi:hypothetical protein
MAYYLPSFPSEMGAFRAKSWRHGGMMATDTMEKSLLVDYNKITQVEPGLVSGSQ